MLKGDKRLNEVIGKLINICCNGSNNPEGDIREICIKLSYIANDPKNTGVCDPFDDNGEVHEIKDEDENDSKIKNNNKFKDDESLAIELQFDENEVAEVVFEEIERYIPENEFTEKWKTLRKSNNLLSKLSFVESYGGCDNDPIRVRKLLSSCGYIC